MGPLGIGFTQPPAGQARAARRRRHRDRAARDLGARRCASAVPAMSLLGFRNGAYAQAARLLRGDVAIATDDGIGPSAITDWSPTCSSASSRATRRGLCVRPTADARGGAADLRRARAVDGAARARGRHGMRLRRLLRLCRATRDRLPAAVRRRADRARPRSWRRAGNDARAAAPPAVDLRGSSWPACELAHPVLNGSGTFDAIAALRTFGDELRDAASPSRPSCRRRSPSLRGAATRRRACGRPRRADQLDRSPEQGPRGVPRARPAGAGHPPGAPDRERGGLLARRVRDPRGGGGRAGRGGGAGAERLLPEREVGMRDRAARRGRWRR